jgi:uncharacterized protein YjbI with pentapeptide repeats
MTVKTRAKRLLLIGGAVVALGTGFAYAAIPGADAVINGCYEKRTGLLRVIDAEAGKKCTQWETPISWSQQYLAGEGLTLTGNVFSVADGSLKAADFSTVDEEGLTSDNIKNESLSGSDLENGTVMTGDVKDESLSGEDLENGSVATTDVQNESLTGTDLENGTVTDGDVQNESLTGTDLENGTVATSDVANESLTGTDLENDTVATSDIANESLTGTDLENGSVATSDIANESLSGTDIKDESLSGDDLAGGSVATAALRANASNAATDFGGFGQQLNSTPATVASATITIPTAGSPPAEHRVLVIGQALVEWHCSCTSPGTVEWQLDERTGSTTATHLLPGPHQSPYRARFSDTFITSVSHVFTAPAGVHELELKVTNRSGTGPTFSTMDVSNASLSVIDLGSV